MKEKIKKIKKKKKLKKKSKKNEANYIYLYINNFIINISYFFIYF